MLGRVASLTRGKRQLAQEDDESEEGKTNDDSLEGSLKPETTKRSNDDDDALGSSSSSSAALEALKPALRPYEHFDYEMTKAKNKNSVILEVPVDTAPSPFMREHMPKDWRQTTAADRLDATNKKMHEYALEKTREKKRRAKKLMSASAPALQGNTSGIKGGTTLSSSSTKPWLPAMEERPPPLEDQLAGMTMSARDQRIKDMRERMAAKIKAFDETISQAQQSEIDDEERAKKRVTRQPKERKSLYTTYDDLSDDEIEGGESIHKSKMRTRRVHFGSYTVKEVLELRKMFNAMDEDASGSVDIEEFVSSASLNSTHMFVNATSMFGSIDRDGSGSISFAELLAVAFPQANVSVRRDMLKFVKKHESQEHMKEKISLDGDQMDEIRDIFKLYDIDDSGGISTEELYEAMVGANPAMREIFSLEEMDKLVCLYDDDGNASLELEEFTKLFRENFMEDKAAEAGGQQNQSKRGSVRS